MISMGYQSLEVATTPSIAYHTGMQRIQHENDAYSFKTQQQQRDTRTCHSCSRVVWSPKDQLVFPADPFVVEGAKTCHSIEGMAIPAGQSQLVTFRSILEGDAQEVQDSEISSGQQNAQLAEKPIMFTRHVSYGWANLGSEGDMDEDISTESSVSSASISDDDEESTSTSGTTSADLRSQSHEDGPLDTMTSLEDSLPIRRGLSNHFVGKSQSFTSFADLKSIGDLAKPENPYAKRRKSIHTYGGRLDRHRSYPPCNPTTGISKRPTSGNRSFFVAGATRNTKRFSFLPKEKDMERGSSGSLSRHQSIPVPFRCYSLTDLQASGC